ncbi:hypothetical protein [Azohydromonas caseinilytica]|uniref:Uncharacterized protein n=1 Tax=Azohydromonas caseinilytica TaxID=2728836 RepID=A0A848FAV4_9BURK|nr:hypothetical protein [Azohydromonas caseinilytica]NML15569.1 hypothetical protein [Azohydromonas caseinilytica]
MDLSGDLTLRPRSTGQDELCSEVLLAGHPCGTVVSGQVLEAAVRCPGGWLLFVTDGVPFEDMLSVHLLNREGRLLDSARIGGPYTTGSFANLRLEPPGTVHFDFIDNARWSVRLLQQPRPALPWLPDMPGVWRGPRLQRHFEIHRDPIPTAS